MVACILECPHQGAWTMVTDCPLFLHWSMFDQDTKLPEHMLHINTDAGARQGVPRGRGGGSPGSYGLHTPLVWLKYQDSPPARVFKETAQLTPRAEVAPGLMWEFPKCDMHTAVAVKPCDRAIQFSTADEKLVQCSSEVSPVQWLRHKSRWEISADEWTVSLSMFGHSVQPILESVGYSSKSDFCSILWQEGNKENVWCTISCNLYWYLEQLLLHHHKPLRILMSLLCPLVTSLQSHYSLIHSSLCLSSFLQLNWTENLLFSLANCTDWLNSELLYTEFTNFLLALHTLMYHLLHSTGLSSVVPSLITSTSHDGDRDGLSNRYEPIFHAANFLRRLYSLFFYF